MKNYLSKLAQSIKPYVAGEQPRDMTYIKLNTNENPYAPSLKVVEVLKQIDIAKLRLYSDPENQTLKQAIADKYNLEINNIFVGNGSDEVLAMCFQAFFDADGSGAAFADITYSFYPVWCDLYGIRKRSLPLKNDFTIDIDSFINCDAQGLVIANPNAPTGIPINIKDLERIIKAQQDKIIIIDEAYADFGRDSAASLVEQYENLLVVKTFSKSYSLAGIRCGYALGNEKLINGLNAIKNSFNSYTVNTLTEKIAAAAISDTQYYAMVCNDVIKTREYTTEQLKNLGFNVLPSGANFVFAQFTGEIVGNDKVNQDDSKIQNKSSAQFLYEELKKRGVLVRYFNKPRIDNYLRITIGTKVQMDAMLDAIKKILF